MPPFSDLDRLRTDLDGLRPLAPEQEARVLQKFRLEWNYNSNAIEGNSLTLGETRSLLLHGLTAEGKPLRDHLDIKGHDEAVRGLEEIVHDDRPLTEQFIREMHQVLLGNEHYKAATTATGQPTRQRIVPGQYKTSANNVRTATGETFYFATPEETPAKMHDLLTWYRQEVETPTLHPVALAAEFHHRFVSIHPFDDGNGRMSRLLMNLILMRYGYPMTVIKADDRNRYLATLSEADAGEPAPFLRFIIENVEASLRLMLRAARGESIDEPSDLDKKLALLKQTLLNQNDETQIIRWSNAQYNFYSLLLEPWLDNLVDITSRFDFAFSQKKFIDYVSWAGSIVPGHSNLTSFDNAKREIVTSLRRPNAVVNEIHFIIHWDGFKQISNTFDMNLLLKFIFHNARFSVIWEINEAEPYSLTYLPIGLEKKIRDFSYQVTYDLEKISQTNLFIANKVYDFIAAKLAEADKPPA